MFFVSLLESNFKCKSLFQEIVYLSRFIYEQAKLLSLNLPLSKIEKEIKKNYSFYWYHYLNVQLEYIKYWQLKLNDLEMLLISLQVIIQSLNFIKKKSNDSHGLALNKISKNLSIRC